MKNTIDTKKAIAFIGIVSIFIVGGYILGHHIIGDKENSMAAAVISPSPSAEATYDYSIDTLPDGIVGKDTTTPTPTPSSKPEDTTPTPDVKASTAPTPAAGSTSGTAPASTPSPAANTGSSSTGSDTSSHAGQSYDPVFGWTDSSGGQSIAIDGDGDINKQVGTMG